MATRSKAPDSRRRLVPDSGRRPPQPLPTRRHGRPGPGAPLLRESPRRRDRRRMDSDQRAPWLTPGPRCRRDVATRQREIRHLGRRRLDVRIDDRLRSIPLVRNAAGQRLKQHASQRVDIRTRIDPLAEKLLGRRVIDRSHHRPGRQRGSRRQPFRQAEVGQIRMLARRRASTRIFPG